MAIQDSVFPLARAANNIVRTNRSAGVMQNTQTSFSQFLSFMSSETQTLKSIKFDQKKIRKIQGINPINTFGRTGNLLSGLTSGALDAASIVGNFFGGGRKPSPKSKAGMPITKGQNVRFGGIRALGIANAVFAGLDFATGLAEGEGVGKAAAGAGGNLAGSLIGGAIGQALIPVPGLGFVIGSMAGGLAGGFLGDRAYETGEKIVGQSKLKEQEKKQKEAALAVSNPQNTWPSTLEKFDRVVNSFNNAVRSGFLGPTTGDYDGTMDEGSDEKPLEPETPEVVNNNQQTGETGEYSVSGGSLPSSKRGSRFGRRWGRQHYGIDYPVPAGTPISVIQPGTVGFSGLDSGGNLSVYIDHTDGSHTRYLHLSKVKVAKGQKIEPGTLIGYSGGEAGAYGSGNSTGPHLHYEYAPKGSGSVDPAQGNNDDKYFRFGGSIQVKPKVTSQTGVMGQSGKPTAILAAGTNDYTNPATAKANVMKTIKELQQKGYNVVVVPPNESGKFAEASKAVQEAAASSGATIEKGKYDSKDPLHLQMSEASRIKQKYGNAQIIGDSNAVRIAGGSMQDVVGQRVVGAGTDDILKFAQGMGRVAPAAPPQTVPQVSASQVQSVPQQTTSSQQMQQVQQYPTYNLQTNKTVVLPIVQGSGKQTPRIISSPSSGQQTVVMPGPSENQVLNSLFKTILLTQLSSS